MSSHDQHCAICRLKGTSFHIETVVTREPKCRRLAAKLTRPDAAWGPQMNKSTARATVAPRVTQDLSRRRTLEKDMMLPVDSEEGSIKLDRIEIHRANNNEIDDAILVLDEVAAWLTSARVQQWPLRFRREWVSSSVEEGYTWLDHVGPRLAATLVLDWSDPIWQLNDDSAGYIHRLAVRRHAAGLGSYLLAWAASEVSLRDPQFLRLDCVATNRRLCEYYEAAGFQHRGDVRVGGAPGERVNTPTQTLVSRYELRLPALPTESPMVP